MVAFEYMTLRLSFVAEETTVDPKDPSWVNRPRLRTQGPSIDKMVISEYLEGVFPKSRLQQQFSDEYYFKPNIPSSFIMGGLLPKIAQLGTEGWEVVEYKFSTEGELFAFALLKRKVQKE